MIGFLFIHSTVPNMQLSDNEGVGGLQEGEFEVFAGAGGRVLYQFTIRVKLPKGASGAKYGF